MIVVFLFRTVTRSVWPRAHSCCCASVSLWPKHLCQFPPQSSHINDKPIRSGVDGLSSNISELFLTFMIPVTTNFKRSKLLFQSFLRRQWQSVKLIWWNEASHRGNGGWRLLSSRQRLKQWTWRMHVGVSYSSCWRPFLIPQLIPLFRN